MTSLVTSKLLTGLEGLKPSDCHCEGICVGCIKGKAHRAKFSKTPSTRNKATRALERIHVDICGPMQVPSLSGSLYLLVIVDEYSRKTFGRCIKSKADAASAIIEFCREASAKLNVAVAEFHSDCGGEFHSTALLEYFKSVGTKVTTAPPYTPQHNAIVERMMRTIVEPARALLHQSGAPLTLWGEAMMTVIYIRNLVGVRKETGLTPDMMFDRNSAKTDVSGLREWGCDVWVLVPDEQQPHRQKLDAKSFICLFLGYGEDGYGYRVYDVATRRVIHTRHIVKFNEGQFTQCKRFRTEEFQAAESVIHPKSDDEYYESLDESMWAAEMKLFKLNQADEPVAEQKSCDPKEIIAIAANPSQAPLPAIVVSDSNRLPAVAPQIEAEQIIPPDPPALVQVALPVGIPGPVPVVPADWNLVRDREPRIRKKNHQYGMVDMDDVGASLAVIAANAAAVSGGDPESLKVALSGPDAQRWVDAVLSELRSDCG
jgi:transposase InsO family protein